METPGSGPHSADRLLYGTAWKKEATADLVYTALRAGFRAIDTAAQWRHYREDLVGAGVRRALAEGVVARRADLYIQTKFTAVGGQDVDGPMPYAVEAPVDEQVRSSVEASLRHFAVGTTVGTAAYLDCVLLHAPLPTRAATRAAWRALLVFVQAGRVRRLGLSNAASVADLQLVVDVAAELAAELDMEPHRAAPAVLQNRFHRQAGYDVALRRFCGQATPPVVYQAFWTLTANRHLVRGQRDTTGIAAVAAGARVTASVALYALIALGLGSFDAVATDDALCPVAILDGTTSPDHMAEDLAGFGRVQDWIKTDEKSMATWTDAVAAFRRSVHET